MKLREICDSMNVSRRAVQGYEKIGLLSASGKDSRGYLLYDIDAQERIRKIKMYQDFGFSLKEIKQIIDAPNEIIKAALKEQIQKLEKEQENHETLLKGAYELMESL